MTKILWSKFISPTPKNIRRWQRILLTFGGLGTIIATGGAMYDWIPMWIVHSMGVATLMGTFLMQFATPKS